MKTLFKIFKEKYTKEQFCPSFLFGLILNPFFIIRRGLYTGVKIISAEFKGGRLLDFGCGSKPYLHLFDVDEYLGCDIKESGHPHKNSSIDVFYDGNYLPFEDESFDWVFSSEVFEHVFNLDEILSELKRVLKNDGLIGFTCPFVWNEHEIPYDFARYSSFGITYIMEKNGFEVIKLNKTTNYFETLMQMCALYIWQFCLPKNKYLKTVLSGIFVSPFNLLGYTLGKVLPESDTFYHNQVVIARKSK